MQGSYLSTGSAPREHFYFHESEFSHTVFRTNLSILAGARYNERQVRLGSCAHSGCTEHIRNTLHERFHPRTVISAIAFVEPVSAVGTHLGSPARRTSLVPYWR